MELKVTGKGNKYIASDRSGKLLYSVKKKGFGSRYNLMDANSYYNLYTLVQTGDSKKPGFTIILNDNVFLSMECTSLFLDPTILARGKEFTFELKSKDRKEFVIFRNKERVGVIHTLSAVNGEFQYDIEIDNTAFDDYIPLFAVAIDKAFGEMNK
ncbi:hypothetical protein [Ruminococcus flavefaciens]|uniref:Uncharacterized protein n=1 Tax=Ruminococcus flavefaciens 007c TaxID=1341157 RepID=W7UXW7_RUMFL|nr:hypothetical protein [Ruminococcus flavefaciens]EWM53202.1 hypothetical protein RF007C_16455 [Ruminococcus flavefaciens 007c]